MLSNDGDQGTDKYPYKNEPPNSGVGRVEACSILGAIYYFVDEAQQYE